MSRRILQLIACLGPGGAERQLAYLCGGLRARGWEVHVGVLADGALRARYESAGARIHDVPSFGNYDPLLPLRLLRLIRRVQPEIVQTWIPMIDIVGGVAARWARVPWILTERSSPSHIARLPKLRLRARLARGAAGVVSNSQSADAYWGASLPAGVARAVIRNALPLEEITAAEPLSLAAFGLPDDAPLVLFVGRLLPLKNIRLLIDALAGVCAQSKAVALLCGVGPLEAPARGWIAERGLSERVKLAGFVPDAVRLMKRASLFVSLSRYEGMPNAVMEAMAAGCPVVASDIPAHREICDASTALLVDVDSGEQAARAMLTSLADPTAAAARAAAAGQRAADWSIESVASAYDDFYAEVLRQAR